MSSILKNKRIWRLALLVLLVAGIIGPWAFDQINVPAEYPCSAPFVRLEGDFCGLPILGIMIMPGMFLEIARRFWEFLTGGLDLALLSSAAMISTVLLLIMLPLLTTSLLLLKRDNHGLRLIHIAALILATGLGVWIRVSGAIEYFWVLWGMWVYFGGAVVGLVLEILSFSLGRKLLRGS